MLRVRAAPCCSPRPARCRCSSTCRRTQPASGLYSLIQNQANASHPAARAASRSTASQRRCCARTWSCCCRSSTRCRASRGAPTCMLAHMHAGPQACWLAGAASACMRAPGRMRGCADCCCSSNVPTLPFLLIAYLMHTPPHARSYPDVLHVELPPEGLPGAKPKWSADIFYFDVRRCGCMGPHAYSRAPACACMGFVAGWTQQAAGCYLMAHACIRTDVARMHAH